LSHTRIARVNGRPGTVRPRVHESAQTSRMVVVRVGSPVRFASPRPIYVLVVVAAVLFGLALRGDLLQAGFFADDFDHYAMWTGRYPVARSPLDLFNFSDGSQHDNAALMESGHFPWWSDPDVHLSMLRPLSSALIAFDLAAFGSDARFAHAHSLLWWALLAAAAAWLLFMVLPPSWAALALVLYVCEEGHSLPAGWLANRSPLVATAFGFVALGAHIRAHRDGVRSMRWVSWMAILLALLAGEYAFSVLAYFVAWEAVGRSHEPWKQRALRLSPLMGMAIAYLVVRHALGIGIDRSGFYLSPTSAPLTFMAALSWRVPVLVGELVLGVPADWYAMGSPWRDVLLRGEWFSRAQWQALPSWPTVHVALGAGGLGIGLWSVIRLARGPAAEARTFDTRAVSWFALGSLFALVPVAGSMVSARLTVAAALGVDVLLAAVLLRALSYMRFGPVGLARVASLLLVAGVTYLHIVSAAQRSHWEAGFIRARSYFENAWVLGAELDERRVAEQHVIVIAARDLTTSWYLPYVRHLSGLPMPRSYWLLSGAAQPHDLERVGEASIELSVLTSYVDAMAVGSNYRPAERPFRVGDEVSLRGFTARVISTLHGQPRRVRFTFAGSLDDSRYVFLASTSRGLRRLQVPAVGERVRLPRPSYPNPGSLAHAREDLGPSLFDLTPQGPVRTR
jgi:hypothetical protein